MKILICDDEMLFADRLKEKISKILLDEKCPAEIELYTDSEFIDCEVMSFDIAFLDIEMEPYNGIETARALKKQNTKIIIFFITAYNQYLDDAMDINAFRYLSKPLDEERLRKGLKKALEKINAADGKKFIIKSDKKSMFVSSDDIIMVEISGRGTYLYTLNGKGYSSNNISFWADNLNASVFLKTHKSYIVNTDFIIDYDKSFVYLVNNYKAPISYRQRTAFNNFILSLIERR